MRMPHEGHQPHDSDRPPPRTPTRSQDDLISRLVDNRGPVHPGEPPARPPDDLLAIARYQKGVIFCILIHLVGVVSYLSFAPEADLFVEFGLLGFSLVEAVFVFRLATRLFGTSLGIALSILTMAPCLGLVPLLVINGRASATLQAHGISVGLLGAPNRDLQRVRAEAAGAGGASNHSSGV